MQKVINFVNKYKEYITFTSLVIISLSLISIGNNSQIGGFRTIVIAGLGIVQQTFSFIPNTGGMLNENRALRELNLQLSTEVVRMRQALIENERLRKMLDLKISSEQELLVADVVGNVNIEMRNYILIDKGIEHGIKRGMPVRTDAGMVGVVLAVSTQYSMVETLNNRHVKISAKIQRTSSHGIFTWQGIDEYILNNIPNTFDVQAGDILITSNYSNKYPENIPIGQVIAVEEDPSSLFYKIIVEPFVNFKTLEQVFVLQYLPDPERLELIKEMENIIQNKQATK